MVILAHFGQCERFQSGRNFYRCARKHLRPAFPTLPYRGQINRLMRRHFGAIVALFCYLVESLQGRQCPYEALDSSCVPARDAKGRGAGRLAGKADIGWSNPQVGMRAAICRPTSILRRSSLEGRVSHETAACKDR